MKLYCRMFGCTWIHKTNNAKISWNTTKKQTELVMTTDEEPKFWLECHRCGQKNESPSKDEIKAINN